MKEEGGVVLATSKTGDGGGDSGGESMPGRIMENVSINGSHTNHEREKRPNGVNGSLTGGIMGSEKGKGRPEPVAAINSTEKMTPNGNGDELMRDATMHQTSGIEEVNQDLISQLPPELLHISSNYFPLSRLVMRVAEHTHNAMESTILELAGLPLPLSAVNGNAAHSLNAGDDNSLENINKKKKLLDFAQDAHTKFTKALVLTQWSERSEDVSKMIDLRVHLMNQEGTFYNAFKFLADVKKDLGFMRVRNPDLKTAVEILSTGKCSWMPDVS